MITVPVDVYSESRHGLPEYARLYDSGMDIRANLVDAKPLTLYRGSKVIIPTGLYFAIPPGYEFQVRPRSGTSFKTSLCVVNAPGTIDSQYRGALGIIIENRGDQLTIADGERIAQLVLAPVVQCEWQRVESKEALGATARGEGGFGSTGNSGSILP